MHINRFSYSLIIFPHVDSLKSFPSGESFVNKNFHVHIYLIGTCGHNTGTEDVL